MIRITKINRKEALRYMSYSRKTEIGEVAAAYLDECEKRIINALSPKYLYRYFPALHESESISLSGCSLHLNGRDIFSHLDGCDGVILMCASIGSEIDKLIRVLRVEDMAKAVIADAFASAAAEQVCSEAEKIMKSEFDGKYFTWRYSPGYGDFPLEIQKALLDVLDAPRKIGLCTSDSYLLTPIKSVTAVIGVSDSPLPQRRRGCVTCNINETCQIRKRGMHCGF